MTEGLATSNRSGGGLAEFGVVMARNDQALLRVLGDTAMRTGLPSTLLELLDQQAEQWRQLRERLAECDRHIAAQARADQRCVRVKQLTGVGALTADAMVASVGNATEIQNGRRRSAWTGLVATPHPPAAHP